MTASDTSRRTKPFGSIVLWVAQIAVASLVLLTGASKLASAPAMVVEFDAIGVGRRSVTSLARSRSRQQCCSRFRRWRRWERSC